MIIGLCACSKAADAQPETDVSTAEATGTEASAADETKTEITLRFFNGDTELGSVTAYVDELVTGYEQFEQLEGYKFMGWYKTPTFLEASFRDLTKDTFRQDTKLFGSFKSAQLTEDTRSWYVVGEGASPVLAGSGWAGASVDDASKAACQLALTGNATNEFSITLDMFAGDKFQVIYDWQWDGQKGFGRFSDLDTACFENGGGISGEKDNANVCVLADGNYTITLTTDPENDKQDYVTVVRNGDPAGAKAEKQEVEFVVSENTSVVMKGSWVADWSENIELARVEGTNTFAGTKELEAGTELYFMFWDNGVDTGIGMNSEAVADDASKALLEDAYNVKVKDGGEYTFTVDADSRTIIVSKAD